MRIFPTNKEFTPISDYGFIGNTRTGALVSKHGSIDWCCFPIFDSPSFFGALLDLEQGYFKISPVGPYDSSQRYIADTNVLETVFKTNSGTVSVLDFFPVDSEKNKHQELWPQHEILRIVECSNGKVEMKMEFFPRPGFGDRKVKLTQAKRCGIRCDAGSEVIFLNHSLSVESIKIDSHKNCVSAPFEVNFNERHFFSLSYSIEAPATIPPLGKWAMERLERTVNYWRTWISQCSYTGEYQDEVRRSALALKLMVFAPSGAIVAAPTTSLPESIFGERNWDYRYCWLRDASFTVRAFINLGFYDEASAYVSWILHSTHLTRPEVQVLYSVYGEARIPETELPSFSGYEYSFPVRIGNAADKQFQLDVYGEVMNAIYLFSPFIEHFDKDTVKFLIGLGEAVCKIWTLPDDGIWEVRSGRCQHTHSKAMAWIALNRLISLCDKYNWTSAPVEEFHREALKIKESIEEHGYNEDIQSYTQLFDGLALDASLLVLPLMGYWEGSAERMFNTSMAIKNNLRDDGLIYRYYTDDGVPGEEGAFCACSFWLVENLAHWKLFDDAKDLFSELLKKRNSLGLWPEEIDSATNTFLGNYPQAFTHTALIGAALSLEQEKHQ